MYAVIGLVQRPRTYHVLSYSGNASIVHIKMGLTLTPQRYQYVETLSGFRTLRRCFRVFKNTIISVLAWTYLWQQS